LYISIEKEMPYPKGSAVFSMPKSFREDRGLRGQRSPKVKSSNGLPLAFLPVVFNHFLQYLGNDCRIGVEIA
jgi:hypothetical protein